MTYKGITIIKTPQGRYQVRETLGTYRQVAFAATFKTLAAARAYIDRMTKGE
jgi:hypothetical protein